MYGAGYDPPWNARDTTERAGPGRARWPRHGRMRVVRDVVLPGGRTAHPVPVIVLPGLGTNDVSTLPLRWYLSRIGHRVVGWQLGVHRLPVETALRAFVPRLESFADTAGRDVTLVGWSLGGVVAREAARRRPDLVAQVITLGSPSGRPPRAVPAGAADRDDITVPVTSIFSRGDRVVGWRSSVDRVTPGASNIEVSGGHAALGLDPVVWRVVADTIEGGASPKSAS